MTGGKLPGDLNFKNFMKLITCVIKDDGKFLLQLFSEKALFLK